MKIKAPSLSASGPLASVAILALFAIGTSACYQEEVDAEIEAKLAAAEAEAGPNLIPRTLRGTWRVSSADEVSFDECRQDEGFETNRGQVFILELNSFNSFEDLSTIVEVHEEDFERIDATFETAIGDTVSQERLVIELDDSYSILTMTPSGNESAPKTRLVRCPLG